MRIATFISALLVASLCLSGVAAAGTLKAGHVLTENHPYHIAWTHVAELVKERSGGSLTIDVFPNSTLGNERDMIEGMQLGMVDLAVVSTGPLSGFSKAFLVLDLPYMFRDHQAAYRVLDNEIGQGMLDSLAKNRLVGFCFWENGFRHITSRKPVRLPEDVKGIKIRTMEAEVHMASFNTLGAIATPMAWGEVYTALQQNTIDGQENPLSNSYQAKIQEVNPYFSLTAHFYAPATVLMSKRVYDSLSAEHRQILTDAILETRDFERKEVAKAEAACLAALKAEGITVIEDIDFDTWRRAVQPVYDQYESTIGADLIRRVAETAAGD